MENKNKDKGYKYWSTHYFLRMFVRLGLIVLAVCLVAAIARPQGWKKVKKETARKDIAIRSKNHGFERPAQGNFISK